MNLYAYYTKLLELCQAKSARKFKTHQKGVVDTFTELYPDMTIQMVSLLGMIMLAEGVESGEQAQKTACP